MFCIYNTKPLTLFGKFLVVLSIKVFFVGLLIDIYLIYRFIVYLFNHLHWF